MLMHAQWAFNHSLDYKGTAKDHTDLKKALSKKKRPKQTEKKLEEADTMQGMEEHAKETIINLLEEITEDAVPVKKKKKCYNTDREKFIKHFF